MILSFESVGGCDGDRPEAAKGEPLSIRRLVERCVDGSSSKEVQEDQATVARCIYGAAI
jgi:hypothetical protein